MAITAGQVKELREKSGAGMMDCKKALMESNGEMEAALDYLRKQGLKASQGRAGRIAAEGIISTHLSDDGKTGVLLELNSETDFVARSDDFKNLCHELALQVVSMDANDVDDLLAQDYVKDSGKKIQDGSGIKSIATAHMGFNLFRGEFIRDYAFRCNELLGADMNLGEDILKSGKEYLIDFDCHVKHADRDGKDY